MAIVKDHGEKNQIAFFFFHNYLTTNMSLIKPVQICMWPLRFTPGIDSWKYGGKIDGVKLIVYELSNIPRKIIMPENV